MDDVAKGGRTVLFVSHNMNAVQRLCRRAVLLDRGQVVADGPAGEVIHRYLTPRLETPSPQEWIHLSGATRTGTGEAYFDAVAYRSDSDAVGLRAYPDGPLEVRLRIVSDAPRSVGSVSVVISDQFGTKQVNADTVSQGIVLLLRKGANEVRIRIEALHLNFGTYRVGLWMYDPLAKRVFDHIEAAFTLQVIDLQPESLGQREDGVTTCQFSVSAL
jgi:lipopolysaccharide transport system ATP-binding protein